MNNMNIRFQSWYAVQTKTKLASYIASYGILEDENQDSQTREVSLEA